MYVGNALMREQAAVLEQAQLQVDASLREPEIAKDLGGYTAKLLALNGELFVPNLLSDGRLSIPASRLDTDAVPAVTYYPNESIVLDETFIPMGPKQQDTAIAKLVTFGFNTSAAVNELENMRWQAADPHSVEIPAAGENTDGFLALSTTDTELTKVDNGNCKIEPLILGGRGLIGVSRELSNLYETELVLIHEETHALLRIERPVVKNDKHKWDERYSRELEAIHVGATFALAKLYWKRQPLTRESLRCEIFIERFRRGLNKDDKPFYPHPALVDLL